MLTFAKLINNQGLFGTEHEGVYKDGVLVAYLANATGQKEDTRLFLVPSDNQVNNLSELMGKPQDKFCLKRNEIKNELQTNPSLLVADPVGIISALLPSGIIQGLSSEGWSYGSLRFCYPRLSGHQMFYSKFQHHLNELLACDIVELYFISENGSIETHQKP